MFSCLCLIDRARLLLGLGESIHLDFVGSVRLVLFSQLALFLLFSVLFHLSVRKNFTSNASTLIVIRTVEVSYRSVLRVVFCSMFFKFVQYRTCLLAEIFNSPSFEYLNRQKPLRNQTAIPLLSEISDDFGWFGLALFVLQPLMPSARCRKHSLLYLGENRPLHPGVVLIAEIAFVDLDFIGLPVFGLFDTSFSVTTLGHIYLIIKHTARFLNFRSKRRPDRAEAIPMEAGSFCG